MTIVSSITEPNLDGITKPISSFEAYMNSLAFMIADAPLRTISFSSFVSDPNRVCFIDDQEFCSCSDCSIAFDESLDAIFDDPSFEMEAIKCSS